jgi:predicted TIM-barrel fold metal-dependent hydrolase
MPAAATDELLMKETLATLERHNVIAVTTGPLAQVRAWRAIAPDRIIPAHAFGDPDSPSVDEFRRLVKDRQLALFAEVSPQYEGKRLDEPSWEPYFALAEELDIPVGVHLGEGPPGGPYWAAPRYRAQSGTPLQLEEVLTRHPKLRLYVMHYGSPLVDEMIAVLYTHPQVYVDIAGNDWSLPRPHFYEQLRRLVDAGFIKRIMWGSDQMVWPRAIEVAHRNNPDGAISERRPEARHLLQQCRTVPSTEPGADRKASRTMRSPLDEDLTNCARKRRLGPKTAQPLVRIS